MTRQAHISIEVVEGGFIVDHRVNLSTDEPKYDEGREVIVTERKLLDKIKTILKTASDEATDDPAE